MEHTRYTLRTTDDVTERDISDIYSELHAYNTAHKEPCEERALGVFCEDAAGKKLAGLTGKTYGNWLCIKYLWVGEALRGRGLGSRILRAAETEAAARGCKYAFVDTFHFQAPGFYKKQGYAEVFAQKEYPYTGARYYYVKPL